MLLCVEDTALPGPLTSFAPLRETRISSPQRVPLAEADRRMLTQSQYTQLGATAVLLQRCSGRRRVLHSRRTYIARAAARSTRAPDTTAAEHYAKRDFCSHLVHQPDQAGLAVDGGGRVGEDEVGRGVGQPR